eukprot:1923965-Pyramimonas_sp.AAC.1
MTGWQGSVPARVVHPSACHGCSPSWPVSHLPLSALATSFPRSARAGYVVYALATGWKWRYLMFADRVSLAPASKGGHTR